MQKSLLLLLLTFFINVSLLPAQAEEKAPIENTQKWKWKKHVKTADELYENSQYDEAAYHYEQAWTKKKSKQQYSYKAGMSYLIVKNYQKAIESFEHLKGNYKKFPTAQFYYARALKHNEQYDEARTEFKDFAERYTGENAADLVSDALAEVEASNLAKTYKENIDRSVRILHLDAAVNSEYTDFAPTPYGNDELLFSSTKQNYAKIFETKRGVKEWESPNIPAQFATLEGEHVCNAVFSPDEKRLYFTVCRSVENWGALTTRCEIFVTKRLGNLWSSPERLSDQVNKEGVTSTQPFIVHSDGKEILYFASNREGGQGGMDIWYASRSLDNDDLNFSAPKNAGAKINTDKNEITPYYSPSEGMLYFSSDGHMGMGGLDIFRIAGALSEWEMPANIGAPYNSGADDYFYVQNRYGDGGFLVSNRTFQKSKLETTDEDIFEFRLNMQQQAYVIKGIVYNKESNVPISDVEVSIYELLGGERERMVKSAVFETGSYLFQVSSDKQYKLVAHKENFQPDTRTFETGPSGTQTEYLYLENNSVEATPVSIPTPPGENPVVTTPPVNDPIPSIPKNTPSKEITRSEPIPTTPNNVLPEYVYTPSTPSEAFRLRTNSPRHTGVYYKVQLVALSKYSEDDAQFNPVRDLGRLDYEVIVDKNITRVLLADYFSKTEAQDILSEVAKNGFKGAFIMKYKDGERIERSR